MPHLYTSSAEKRTDLWLGFGGWVGLAVLAPLAAWWFSLGLVSVATLIYGTAGVALLLLVTRPYAAFGVLLAAATVVALVVVELPFFLFSLVIDAATGRPETPYCADTQALCLGPASTTALLIAGLAVFCLAAWFSLRGIDRRLR